MGLLIKTSFQSIQLYQSELAVRFLKNVLKSKLPETNFNERLSRYLPSRYLFVQSQWEHQNNV